MKLQSKVKFIVIGGYAINAYTLPRFSIDCDIVVKNKKAMLAVKRILEKNGFKENASGATAYKGEFLALAAEKPAKTTFDILAGSVEDRITETHFPAELIFKHSKERTIFGKGSPIKIKVRTVDAEMLFIMKATSARKSDIRDVFMLASTKLDKKQIREIAKENPVPKKSIEKILETIETTGLKDALQGVYGKLPEEQFQKTKKKLKATLKLD